MTAWDQYRPEYPGGLKLVHVDTNQVPKHRVTHLPSPIRPRIRERIDISRAGNPQELGELFEAHLQSRWQEVHKKTSGGKSPVLQIALVGELGFEAFQLDIQDLVDRADMICKPLVCQIALVESPELFLSDPDEEDESLTEVEHRILRDMILQHPSYRSTPDRWLDAVKTTSELVMARAEPKLVYETLNSFDGLDSVACDK